MKSIEVGLCQCGCGQTTDISRQRDKSFGQPYRFRHGHGKLPVLKVRVRLDLGCWDWLGAKLGGYGRVRIHGRVVQAHRLIWERFKGAIPDQLQLDHLCRRRCCVNPAHLEIVTHAENSRRGRCKLNILQVREIRELCHDGISFGSIAKLYGVSVGSIQHIAKNRSWKDENFTPVRRADYHLGIQRSRDNWVREENLNSPRIN